MMLMPPAHSEGGSTGGPPGRVRAGLVGRRRWLSFGQPVRRVSCSGLHSASNRFEFMAGAAAAAARQPPAPQVLRGRPSSLCVQYVQAARWQ